MVSQAPLERIYTALTVQLDYLRLLAFPLELSTDYTYAEVEPVAPLQLGCLDLPGAGLDVQVGSQGGVARCRRQPDRRWF